MSKLKDWSPEDVIKNPEEYVENVEGVFSKEMIIKIAKGGIVTLSIGGKPIGSITELNFEAVVDGEIGNVNKFEVTQVKLVPSDDGEEGFWEHGERSFLTIEEFIAAQESKEEG